MAKNLLGETFVEIIVDQRQSDRALKDFVRKSTQASKQAERQFKQMGDPLRQARNRADEMKRSITDAGRASRMIRTQMIGFGRAASGALTSILGFKALSGISDVMGELVRQGFEFNAQMERLESVFALLLGSVKDARTMTKDLFEFASKTPLQLQEVARAGTMLLATQKIAKDELLPTLRIIADTAAASTEGFGAFPRIARALSQMLSKGRIMAEEMNRQIAEIGIPAWDILSKKIGISVMELREMGERGELGLREIQALVLGLGDTYEGMAKTASRQFLGLASTLRDNVGRAMGEIMEQAFELAKIDLTNLVDFFESDAARAFVMNLKEGVAQLAIAAERITTAESNTNQLSKGAEGVSGAFSDWATWLSRVVESLGQIPGMLENIAAQAQPLFAIPSLMSDLVARGAVGAHPGSRMGEMLENPEQRALFRSLRNEMFAFGAERPEHLRSGRARTMSQGASSETMERLRLGIPLNDADIDKLPAGQRGRVKAALAKAKQAGIPLSEAIQRQGPPKPTTAEARERKAFSRERETLRRGLRTPQEIFQEDVAKAQRLFKGEPVLLARAVRDAREKLQQTIDKESRDPEATRIIDSVKTPLQQFQDELTKVNRMHMEGRISMEVLSKKRKQLSDEFAADAKKRRDERMRPGLRAAATVRRFLAPEKEAAVARMREIEAGARAGELTLEERRAAGLKTIFDLARGVAGGGTQPQSVAITTAAGVNRAIQQSLQATPGQQITKKDVIKSLRLLEDDFPKLVSALSKDIPGLLERLATIGK